MYGNVCDISPHARIVDAHMRAHLVFVQMHMLFAQILCTLAHTSYTKRTHTRNLIPCLHLHTSCVHTHTPHARHPPTPPQIHTPTWSCAAIHRGTSTGCASLSSNTATCSPPPPPAPPEFCAGAASGAEGAGCTAGSRGITPSKCSRAVLVQTPPQPQQDW